MSPTTSINHSIKFLWGAFQDQKLSQAFFFIIEKQNQDKEEGKYRRKYKRRKQISLKLVGMLFFSVRKVR